MWLVALVTCDRWHATPDMWHLTADTWHLICFLDFFVSYLPSANVERFSVSRMRDFCLSILNYSPNIYSHSRATVPSLSRTRTRRVVANNCLVLLVVLRPHIPVLRCFTEVTQSFSTTCRQSFSQITKPLHRLYLKANFSVVCHLLNTSSLFMRSLFFCTE